MTALEDAANRQHRMLTKGCRLLESMSHNTEHTLRCVELWESKTAGTFVVVWYNKTCYDVFQNHN